MSLAARMRKARESVVELGGFKIKIRRPTDLDMSARPTQGDTRDHMEYWTRFVVGWSGVREIDLVPGGTDAAATFNLEDFREWFADQPKHWETLIDAIRGAWVSYHEKKEVDSKN